MTKEGHLPLNLEEMVESMPPLTTWQHRSETVVIQIVKLRSRPLTTDEVIEGRTLPPEDESG